MSGDLLDPTTMLEIKLNAAKRASERIPRQGAHRLADFMTVDDYRHGVRRTFSEAEEFDEWMVSPLLRQFQATEAFEQRCLDAFSTLLPMAFGRAA